MKRNAEMKAIRRPLTTHLLMVEWLVASPEKEMTLNGDYSALQDMEAQDSYCPVNVPQCSYSTLKWH